jgi:hypothetical protein
MRSLTTGTDRGTGSCHTRRKAMGTRAITRLGLLALLLVAAGCGKSGGGGGAPAVTATDPNAPAITNLRATFGPGCTLSDQRAGTIERLSFDYVDADGNLRGGVVDNRTSAPVGGSITVALALPSGGVTMTGTTSGTITITACLHFGSNSSISEEVRVTDTSGKVSNVLAAEIARPAGLPLLPRDADPSIGKSFGLAP